MSRYTTAVGAEAEYEPGSRRRVLQNLLGITSKVEMDVLELESLVRVQEAYYLTPSLVSQCITANFISGMHKDWLGDIYSWAGSYRTVEVAKADFAWPPAYLVPEHMASFEKDVLAANTPCKADGLDKVCLSMAVVHAELLLIHPF
jgi:cell filamentation protein